MRPNVLVFDIETIPDVDAGRRVFGLDGLADRDVGNALFTLRRQESGSDFLRHHLHRIVAISAVLRTSDKVQCWSLGDADSCEKDLLERFFKGIERYSPNLVSWNGGGFDLPVIHYRALLHGVASPRYWDTGEDDRDFKWNNYLSRYHTRHLDLMDYLAMFSGRANAPLDQIASLLGFPGKMGMAGDKVWDTWLAGDIHAIRDYCETDVLNTWLVYLRFELIRGHLFPERYAEELALLKAYLRSENRPHFTQFLEQWENGAAS